MNVLKFRNVSVKSNSQVFCDIEAYFEDANVLNMALEEGERLQLRNLWGANPYKQRELFVPTLKAVFEFNKEDQYGVKNEVIGWVKIFFQNGNAIILKQQGNVRIG